MKTRLPVRQGDILIIPVAKRDLPKNLVPVNRDQRGRLILAEGEETGHAHAILDNPATLFRQADLDEMADRFLMVESAQAYLFTKTGEQREHRGERRDIYTVTEEATGKVIGRSVCPPDNGREIGVPVVHEEHDVTVIPAGAHIVRHKREYHPAEIRRVFD